MVSTEQIIAPSAAISGLTYLPNYITAAQEADLLEAIDTQPWITELKRRVQHYGYRYDYKTRGVSQKDHLGTPPEWIQSYAAGLHQRGLFPQIPDQIIVNEYEPGQGISAHIDCVPCFGEPIASLSLGSACIMDSMHGKTGEKQSMLLEPRSLIILSGEARYQWKHAIAARKSDRLNGGLIPRMRRVSLTFRLMLHTS